MSKFTIGDVVKRVLPSGIIVGEPMIVKGYISGKNLVVCIGSVTKKAMLYKSTSLSKESTRKLIVKENELKVLERTHGIGVFYHELSKSYEDIYKKAPKYISFTHQNNNKRLIYHLAKVEKVIKTIGFSHDSNYQPYRIGRPMIKLTFIGELS